VTTEGGVTVRNLSRFEDLRRCVDFQQEIWGPGFNELVPAAVLWVAVNTGGIVAAALDEAGDFAGFIFGITGWKDGRPTHWSDMLAVRKDLRGRGIGMMLKRHQRDTLLERGVDNVVWTFDPLESRNAWLNLTRLGATTREYRRDCYGPATSPLHSLGTDRVVVRWQLASDRVRHRMEGGGAQVVEAGDAPVINPAGGSVDLDLDAPLLRLRIPTDIQVLKAADPAAAVEWRTVTRSAFEAYFARGYEAVQLLREGRAGSSYLLVRQQAG
jgi:predicted GNAT superfamily acetyltransferase